MHRRLFAGAEFKGIIAMTGGLVGTAVYFEAESCVDNASDNDGITTALRCHRSIGRIPLAHSDP